MLSGGEGFLGARVCQHLCFRARRPECAYRGGCSSQFVGGASLCVHGRSSTAVAKVGLGASWQAGVWAELQVGWVAIEVAVSVPEPSSVFDEERQRSTRLATAATRWRSASDVWIGLCCPTSPTSRCTNKHVTYSRNPPTFTLPCRLQPGKSQPRRNALPAWPLVRPDTLLSLTHHRHPPKDALCFAVHHAAC